MSYTAPYIDAAGLHLPSFNDVLSYLNSNYAAIWGQTVTSNLSSFDVQANTIEALLITDAYNALQLAINGMGPTTAISTQQDLLYKLNGIARNAPTYSTCYVTCTGTPGTALPAIPAVLDTNGNVWDLPMGVVIGLAGTVTVQATCTILGAVTAAIGALTTIATPTAGWTSVTNSGAAIPGAPAETDSNFRSRQAISVALPSKSLVAGTLSGIAATAGVTRYNNGSQTINGASPIENPTGSVDVFGNPAHSISMVVEGGTTLAVATAIYLNKTPGCFTNGTTTQNVNDPTTGATISISFFRPTYEPIFVTLSIHALNGYTTSTTTAIQVAIAAYLNSLQIGESLTLSALYSAANSVMPSLATPIFSIKALYAGETVTGIASFTLGAAAGTGYTVNDVLTVAGGTGGTLKVLTITGGGGTGPVGTLGFITPGSGYSLGTNAATTGGTGTGAQVNITALGPNTSADIAILFNQVVSGLSSNVFVNLV